MTSLLGAMIVCAFAAQPAKADPTWTASGSGSDGALNAQAVFTITNGQIKVTITNLLDRAAITSAGQAVSDLQFTLSNAPGTNSSNTAAGQLVTVGSAGSVTATSGTPGRWIGLESGKGAFGISGNTITLETIGGGKPDELILPSDGGSGYGAANASITKNFSPFVDGPATFTLNLTGVTTSTTISSVIFSFGTTPDTFLYGTSVPSVPEPASILLLGGVACLMSRKLFKKSV